MVDPDLESARRGSLPRARGPGSQGRPGRGENTGRVGARQDGAAEAARLAKGEG